jgi:ribbon-helix-helix CopG family protein
MDQVFSARIDEEVAKQIGLLARRLGTSKKAVIERAIEELSKLVDSQESFNIFAHTHGIWRRDESAEETVAKARKVFKDSMKRHDK